MYGNVEKALRDEDEEEQHINRAYWEAIQGHGSPADRFTEAWLVECPKTPSVPYTPDTECPNEPQSD